MSKKLRRKFNIRYIIRQPMRLLDFLIMRGIRYVSYFLYYPALLWRAKSIRNGLLWLAIASALIAEFFGLSVLFGLLSTAGQFVMSATFMIAQFAFLFYFLSRTKNTKFLPGDKGMVSFKTDYFGNQHLVDVVLGTLDMMSRDKQDAMKALGAEPPHGLVLTGPPGTGKTLLAQCAATAIGIPFIGITGSDFLAMFMGVGAMIVMQLGALGQKLADEWGGCVIFIDEIDAIAMSRGAVEGESSKPQQTGGIFGGGQIGVFSKLLTTMDGTKELHLRKQIVNKIHKFFGYEPITQGQVFWMGATNRLGVIDSALLRPGRMDMIVQVDAPDKGSRRQIIQGYVDMITHDDTVDVERLTDDTQGITPALIDAAVHRTSARFTIQDGRDKISMTDIENALLEAIVGVANPIAEFDEGQREQVATHEAGHAVVSRLLMPELRITNLSIVRRGKGILGYMRDVSPEELYAYPLAHLCARIQVAWAGDIACELILGERWSGGIGDFNHVTLLMKTLASHGYFADRLPRDLQNPFADKVIDAAATAYDIQMKRGTRRLIRENRAVTETLQEALMDKGELNSAEISEIMERYNL